MMDAKKFWLSIVVPCYNPEKYLKRLLESFTKQNPANVEFIFVDDCSRHDFSDSIVAFGDSVASAGCRAFIARTSEDSMHCPGNSRQAGLDIASGEWIAFIDQDDEFLDGAFDAFKCFAEQNLSPFILTPFSEYFEDGTSGQPMNGMQWLHGNLYRLDYVKERGIAFRKDMVGYEDIWFNNSIRLAMHADGMAPLSADADVYKWNAESDSFSRIDDLKYRHEHFVDYLECESQYSKVAKGDEDMMAECVGYFIMAYFWVQHMFSEYRDLGDYSIKKAVWRKYLDDFEKITETDDGMLLERIYGNPQAYYDNMEAERGIYVQFESFKEFLTRV